MPVKSRNSIYRPNRKDEHILLALRQKPGLADFSDIHLINNCLPERDLNEVTLETTLMGTPLRSPLFINAVTGGTPLAMRVNQALAAVAARCDLPMALGSQMAALENPALEATYRVVRRTNPRGVIWANLGSYASPEMVRRAVEMVGASAVQIHLNVPQELAMREGDCRILSDKEICQASPVPVIVKVGSASPAATYSRGAESPPLTGGGGTNFYYRAAAPETAFPDCSRPPTLLCSRCCRPSREAMLDRRRA